MKISMVVTQKMHQSKYLIQVPTRKRVLAVLQSHRLRGLAGLKRGFRAAGRGLQQVRRLEEVDRLSVRWLRQLQVDQVRGRHQLERRLHSGKTCVTSPRLATARARVSLK